MSAAGPAAGPDHPARHDAQVPLAALALAGLLVASCLLSLWLPPLGDMPWRLHVAGEVLAGAQIYRDVIETNPPAWFWAALPAAWIGAATGLDPYPVLVVLVHLAVAACLPVWDRLVRGCLDPAERAASWSAVAFAALVLPAGELGQREPAAMLAALLWIALACARARQERLPAWLVVAASLVAAYGFALKHYFILIPVLTELALALHQRGRWRPLRLETVVLCGCAVAYGIAVVLLTPAFLTSIVPLVGLSYGGFGPAVVHGEAAVLARIAGGCAIVALAALAAWRTGETRPLVWGIVGAALVFALIAAVQMKGWRYHLLAAQGCALVVLALVACGARRPGRMLAAALLVVGVVVTAIVPLRASVSSGGVRAEPAVETLLHGLAPGQRLMVLDTAPETAFLYPAARGHRPASRHYALWMLPGLGGATGRPASPAAGQARALVMDELRDDIACRRADWIVVADHGSLTGLADVLARDPDTRAILQTLYQRRPDAGAYRVWQLRPGAPQPAPCRSLR